MEKERSDLIELFISDYDYLCRKMVQVKSYKTIKYTVLSLLELLVEIVKENRLSELDNYMIYNTLLISRMCESALTMGRLIPNSFIYVQQRIEELFQELENLNVTKENYKTR